MLDDADDEAGPSSDAFAHTEPVKGVVGYALTDKKRRSLLTPEFVARARCACRSLLSNKKPEARGSNSSRGLRFFPIDPLRSLEEQVRCSSKCAASSVSSVTPSRLRLQEGHPFDVILHKARTRCAPAVATAAPLAGSEPPARSCPRPRRTYGTGSRGSPLTRATTRGRASSTHPRQRDRRVWRRRESPLAPADAAACTL